jgi:nucleoside-diphosphate-sugar epimerase
VHEVIADQPLRAHGVGKVQCERFLFERFARTGFPATSVRVHWGEGTAGGIVVSITKALEHLDWAPRIGLEEGYRDSYAWYAAGGRDLYEYDFSFDDDVLARTGRG